MKYVIVLVFLFGSASSLASDRLPADCSHLSDITEATIVLFNKKEFIQLGECLAITVLKNNKSLDLVRSCNEVDEDRRNFLGIFSLSKLESILLGQCMGTINYIYEHYHREIVDDAYGRSAYGRVYRCIRGVEAVDILRKSTVREISREEVRHLLCDEVYN